MRISLQLIISVLCSFSEIFTNDIKEKNSKPFEKKKSSTLDFTISWENGKRSRQKNFPETKQTKN